MPKLMRSIAVSLPERIKNVANQDGGAIAPLFIILLGSGLFIMLMGLVVDGGQVYVQKRLVQNAADNVSEAIAQHCAKELTTVNDCLHDSFAISAANSTTPITFAGQVWTTSVDSYLSTLANPKGGSVAVTKICGQSTLTLRLPLCAPLGASPNDCKTDMAAAGYANWLRVYTSSDPAGLTPAFENFLNGNSPKKYQETACSQVAWGIASAAPIYATGNQLPFLIGICSVTLNQATSAVNLPISGQDTDKSACPTFRDRNNQPLPAAGTAHGFFQFDPASSDHSCWTLLAANCTPTPLPASASLTALVNTTKISFKKPVVLPVVDWVGTKLTVVGFVAFYLTYYKFYSSTPTVTPTPTGCNTNPTNFCILGQFQNRIIQPFGQVQGLTTTTNPIVPNLGYQVMKHVS